ncbi:hypothetical protein CNR22_07770 [Sphingobacteriaceae bacterium]|nr:hypothetical protein CNR22_07770 [Sphingobacteriaceae bacterium]
MSAEEKKKSRKSTIIAVSVFILMIPAVWLLMNFFATESVIDYMHVDLNGQKRCIILSEKTGSKGNRDKSVHDQNAGNGKTHFGYFLEVYDSISNKSLHKIDFSSPVSKIQDTPQLRVLDDGVIWIVSTTNSADDDRRGFILKFSVENDKLIKQTFTLDEKYKIRELIDNSILLSENSDFPGVFNDPVFGCIYLDLETGKIVDTRKTYGKSDKHSRHGK